jgi:hypothetical protein
MGVKIGTPRGNALLNHIVLTSAEVRKKIDPN